MKLKKLSRFFFLLFSTLFFLASCSSVRYTYYNKHKVPYSAPEETKLPEAIPSKPFLTETETTLKEVPEQKKDNTPAKAVTENTGKKTNVILAEQPKAVSEFDINKFFKDHKYVIKTRETGNLDDRTTIIILLVILILVLLALVGDGLLWLLWLALLVLLIFALIKYLGLFG